MLSGFGGRKSIIRLTGFRGGAGAHMMRGFFRLSAASTRTRKASTAVELALVAPFLMLLLMGTIEMAMIEGAQQLLENAAYNTSRLAKTGYTTSGSSQMTTVSQELTKELQSYGKLIDTGKVTMSAQAYNSFSGIGGAGTSGLGDAKQIVVYTIAYPWKVFTPMLGKIIGSADAQGNLIVNLTSRIVVRNEPY